MEERNFSLEMSREEKFQFTVAFDEDSFAHLLMDEPAPLGDNRGPNAARVLGAAVGNCLSASLLFCLQRARVPVAGFRTRVEGTIVRNEQGRMRIGELRVKLAPEVASEHRERMERCLGMFEDFCIVSQSVRQGIDVKVEVEPALGPAEAGAGA